MSSIAIQIDEVKMVENGKSKMLKRQKMRIKRLVNKLRFSGFYGAHASRVSQLQDSLKASRAAIQGLNERNEKLKKSLFEARAQLKNPQCQVTTTAKVAGKRQQQSGIVDIPRPVESTLRRNFPDFSPDRVINASQGWCSFGVRDPFFLMNEQGGLELHDGSYLMFFSGRDKPLTENGRTSIGVARSQDLIHWDVDEEPIFQDGPYATSGGIVKLASGIIRLYYAFDTARGFRIAETTDLKSWDIRKEPIAEPRQFHCRRIGLPHVFRHNGRWFAFFEGLRKHFNIYAMTSDDGISWMPLHEGEPAYLPTVGAWDDLAQANPSVAWIDGELCLAYNGYSSQGDWDIGLRKLGDLTQRLQGSGSAPLLGREDLKDHETKRLEGVRIFDIKARNDSHIFFFDLPTADGFKGGRVWQLSIDKDIARKSFDQSLVNKQGEEIVALQPRFVDIRDNEVVKNDVEASTKNALAEEEFNDGFAQAYYDIWDRQPIQRITKTLENKWIRELVKSGDKILLVGSGGGREIECLLDIGADITAMDISPGMLEIGRARYPDAKINWVHADVQNPPAWLNEFDHVLGLGLVLCYLPNPDLALAKLRDVVKTGGTLTLGLVNSQHYTEKNPKKYLNSGRVRFAYSTQEIKGMLQRAGYIQTALHGSRFFIDGVPNSWNSPDASSESQSALMNRFSDLEISLSEEMEPELAKHLWVTARAI